MAGLSRYGPGPEMLVTGNRSPGNRPGRGPRTARPCLRASAGIFTVWGRGSEVSLRHVSKPRHHKILAAYRLGERVTDIARQFATSRGYVYFVLRAAGIFSKRTPGPERKGKEMSAIKGQPKKGVIKLGIVKQFYPGVTHVIDALQPLVLEVEKGDIRRDKRKKHRECAVAEACKRKFSLDGAIISRATAYLIKDNIATRYIVPAKINREITSFDRTGYFAPGSYALYPVPPSHNEKRGGYAGKRTRQHILARKPIEGLRASLVR
jgi:hypothetical protein